MAGTALLNERVPAILFAPFAGYALNSQVELLEQGRV